MRRAALALLLVACAARQKAAAPLDEYAAARARVDTARKAGELDQLREQLRSPSSAIGFYTLGLAEFAAGNEREAVAALRQAAAMKPDVADIQYRLGVALLDGEKFADARAPLQRAAQLAPKTARYRPPLALCLGRLGDRKGALEALRDFASLSPTPDEAALAVKTARSLTDLFRDLPPAARAELEQALGYLVRDAPGLAAPQLETLLGKLPDLAAAHALLGLASARLDEAGRAVTELKRASELQPDLPQPHAWLAELYAAKDRPDLALAEYALALERNPLDAESLRHLGELRLARSAPESLDPLRQAAVLAPDDDGLQLLVARAEIAAGQPAPAQARLEKLSEKRPEDAEVLLRLAMLLFDQRQKAPPQSRGDLTHRVETLLQRVLALQPENATANRLLDALRAG
ncbi:MAG TPA: tetratricopeptide repeat protein [Myxococcales bacterium]|nr:tetratricopeptide repeat protein [Myxococcales bacterium]